MLSIIVLYSFAYLLLLSGSLFLFIFVRRLIVEAFERKDRRTYEAMEKELLEVLTSPSPGRAAFFRFLTPLDGLPHGCVIERSAAAASASSGHPG